MHKQQIQEQANNHASSEQNPFGKQQSFETFPLSDSGKHIPREARGLYAAYFLGNLGPALWRIKGKRIPEQLTNTRMQSLSSFPVHYLFLIMLYVFMKCKSEFPISL